MMPLVFAENGEENIIKKVGGTPETKKHLEDLGFVPGGAVTVVTTVGGNIDREYQGIPRRHQQGNGEQDHDLSLRETGVCP